MGWRTRSHMGWRTRNHRGRTRPTMDRRGKEEKYLVRNK